MPSPEVQFCLDGSVQCHHIAGDTYHYLMDICRNADEVFDAYRETRRFEKNWEGLADMGLYLESRYLDWRASKPEDHHVASLMGVRSVAPLILDLVREAAQIVVDSGRDTFDRSARSYINERFGFDCSLDLYRRALKRGASDFAGRDAEYLFSLQRVLEARDAERREERARIIAELNEPEDQKNTARIIRARRKSIKKSVKFLSSLIGDEKTRVFISGQMVRVEGRHAIYEFHRNSSLSDAHGGLAALKVFDKDYPDLHLCDVCIFTRDVPLLDHVASLIMHIRADMEEEILNIGNPGNIAAAAYDRNWLVPFLPPPRESEPKWVGIPRIDIPGWETRSDIPEVKRKRLIARMSNRIGRTAYSEVLAPHAGLIRACQEVTHSSPMTRWEIDLAAGQVNLIE